MPPNILVVKEDTAYQCCHTEGYRKNTSSEEEDLSTIDTILEKLNNSNTQQKTEECMSPLKTASLHQDICMQT